MRAIVGTFGIVCSVIVVALVARYGYKTSDTEIDGLITAFLFGVITTGGLGGHAVAIRIWQRSGVWAVLIGLIAAIALTVNLSNSLGAIAGRGDERSAARLKSAEAIKDARGELARVTRERESIPVFQATTAEAVQFARDAVAAAERTTKAECETRRTRCREREGEEHSRRAELAQVVSNRAATERAAHLEAELVAIRGRLASVAPVGSINPQATALVQLFQLPDAYASAALYYQYLAVAVVVELLIAGSFVAYELMSGHGALSPAVAGVVEGAPEKFCSDIVRHKPGRRVPPAPVYPAYEAWCARLGLRAVDVERFVDRFFSACDAAGIRRETRGGVVYLTDVELAG